MWRVTIGKALSGVVGWILAALGAVIVAVSIYAWYATSALNQSRDHLATARAEIRQCVRANESASATIQALIESAEQNALLRDMALQSQRDAVERIRKLEALDREPEIIEIRKAADGDACAHALLPESIRVQLTAERGD